MRSHTIAVYDADGKIHTVNADEIRMCAPTSKCIKFWVQFASALIVIGLGTFFMVWQGTSSLYFNIGEGSFFLSPKTSARSGGKKNKCPPRVERIENWEIINYLTVDR